MVRSSAALLLASLHFGCSTTSTIYRYNEPPIEAHVEGGSPTALAISDGNSGTFVVPRSEIASIDYPGNVHATVGGIFLGYGVLNIAVGLPECKKDSQFSSDSQQSAYCVGVFLPAIIGAGMLIWGVVTNLGAKRSVEDQTMTLAAPPQAPPPRPIPATTAAPIAPAVLPEPPAAPAPQTPPAPAPAPPPEAAPPPAQPAPPAPAAPPPAPAPDNTRSFPSGG